MATLEKLAIWAEEFMAVAQSPHLLKAKLAERFGAQQPNAMFWAFLIDRLKKKKGLSGKEIARCLDLSEGLVTQHGTLVRLEICDQRQIASGDMAAFAGYKIVSKRVSRAELERSGKPTISRVNSEIRKKEDEPRTLPEVKKMLRKHRPHPVIASCCWVLLRYIEGSITDGEFDKELGTAISKQSGNIRP